MKGLNSIWEIQVKFGALRIVVGSIWGISVRYGNALCLKEFSTAMVSYPSDNPFPNAIISTLLVFIIGIALALMSACTLEPEEKERIIYPGNESQPGIELDPEERTIHFETVIKVSRYQADKPWFGDNWPFTVSSGVVTCLAGGNVRLFLDLEENGTGGIYVLDEKSSTSLPSIRSISRVDVNGAYMSSPELLQASGFLCEGKSEEELALAFSFPPTPIPTPVPKKIRQRARTANWEIKVVERPYILSPNRNFKGTPVAVKVNVKNIGNEGSTIYRSQFELEDSVGRVYKTASVYDDKALIVEDINPGLQFEGFVVFDLPISSLKQSSKWKLVVDGAMFQDQAIFDLNSIWTWKDMR